MIHMLGPGQNPEQHQEHHIRRLIDGVGTAFQRYRALQHTVQVKFVCKPSKLRESSVAGHVFASKCHLYLFHASPSLFVCAYYRCVRRITIHDG